SSPISVNSTAPTHFVVSTSGPITAGMPFNVTVTAEDGSNNVTAGYNGTVTLGDSLSGATFRSASFSNGVATFTATLDTAGSQTITATDTGLPSLTGNEVLSVNSATATHLVIGAPSTVTVGSPFSFNVTAEDQFDNVATAFTGTVNLSSSDSSASLIPPTYTFTGMDAGIHAFNGTLNSSGNQTISAND